MQLGRHSRIDYASPSLLQRHRNRCPCACSRGFARCRGVARVTTSFRLPNIANSNLEASPKFSRFWFEGFASLLPILAFPHSGVEASPNFSRCWREGFAARFPFLSFPYSGLEASRLRSICIAGRTYATLHVRCEDRAMKNQNQICNTYETGKICILYRSLKVCIDFRRFA